MSRRLSDCLCRWDTVAELPVHVPIMTTRSPECPQHGDDTGWWARTQEHARTLQVQP